MTIQWFRVTMLAMLALLALALLVLWSSLPVHAATCVWTGAVDTSWSNASNWSNCNGGVPSVSDTAEIGPATNNPSITTPVSVGAIIINNGGALTVGITTTVGTVTINSGGVLTYSAGTGTTFTITTFNIYDGGKYVHDRDALIPIHGTNRNFSSTSTIEIQRFGYPSSDLPTFGNLIVNNSSEIVQFSGRLVTVTGSLTKKGSRELRFATTQPVTITLAGNFDIQEGTVTIQSGSTTNAASISMSGSVSIGSGATLQRGSGATGLWSFDVSGGWSNSGTFTPGNSTVTFNGSSVQTIGGSGATTFNNLTINNSSGVTLNNNATVTGTLTFASGDLNTSSHTLTLGSNATVTGSGDVVGNVQRAHAFNIGTNYAFNNANTLINFSSVTNGASPSIVINLSKSAPAGLTTAVPRTYTITPTNISSYDATLRLGYLDSETGGMTEANLRAWRHNGTRWVLQSGGVDTTNNYVYASNVTAFSNWAITDNGAPTVVTLSSFAARADAPNALLLIVLAALAAVVLGGVVWKNSGTMCQ